MIQVQQGYTPADATQAAHLYDAAFGSKYRSAIPSRERRILLLSEALDPAYCFAAFHEDQLVGIAGFQGPQGSFTGGIHWEGLRKHCGFAGACRAAPLLALLSRSPAEGELLMDGISVLADFRGQGIGRQLLQAIITHAQQEKDQHVRLDVIDQNLDARRLYERMGFQEVNQQRFPLLKPLLGFSGSTEMHYSIPSEPL